MTVSVIQFVSTGSLYRQFRKNDELQRTDSLQVVSNVVCCRVVFQPCNRVTVTDCTICTVFTLVRNHRRNHVHLTEELSQVYTCIRVVRFSDVDTRVRHAERSFQPVLWLTVQVQTHVVLVLASIQNQTILTLVTYRSHITHLFCTTVDADAVLSLEARFSVHQIMPVSVSIVRICTIAELFDLFSSIERFLTYVLICLVSQLSVFSRSCIFRQLSQRLPTYQTRVVYLALTSLTTLGSNQDDTVRSLRTVDS